MNCGKYDGLSNEIFILNRTLMFIEFLSFTVYILEFYVSIY